MMKPICPAQSFVTYTYVCARMHALRESQKIAHIHTYYGKLQKIAQQIHFQFCQCSFAFPVFSSSFAFPNCIFRFAFPDSTFRNAFPVLHFQKSTSKKQNSETEGRVGYAGLKGEDAFDSSAGVVSVCNVSHQPDLPICSFQN